LSTLLLPPFRRERSELLASLPVMITVHSGGRSARSLGLAAVPGDVDG
jgi:hypothetical protein